MSVRIWLAILAALLGPGAPACGAPLVGTVSLSPTCSGPQLEASGCSQPMADARLRLFDSHGTLVAQTTADAQGRFMLDASAGAYRVQVMVPGKLPRCPTPEVTLPTTEHLRIDCDSGRR